MTSFTKLSHRAASDFLNTVVVVDDQALLAVSAASDSPHSLKRPGRQGGSTTTATVESAVATTDAAHRLDAKKLIDSFARNGIVCSILRPEEQEMDSFKNVLFPVTSGSDVVILDWVLHEFKQGEKTVEIIKRLLRSTGPDRGRARLIIVYTGENALNQIGLTIRDALGMPAPTNTEDPYTIQYHRTARICIYAKEQSRLPNIQQSRQIEIAKLPDVVISEFANMTSGLLSNVALVSLAKLRANTHQLLKRFHRELDPPFVTHSTLLIPEAASDHLIPLIVSEIQSILQDAEVSGGAEPAAVAAWLKDQIRQGLKFQLPQHTTERDFRLGLAFLLRYGLKDEGLTTLFQEHLKFAMGFLKSKEKAAKTARKELTRILTLERDAAAVSDNELALLMSVRSRYASPLPYLSLGTIVLEKYENKSQHLLCLQPRCDSVRLKSKRAFIFLPMTPVPSDKNCQLIVEDGGKILEFRLSDNAFDCRVIKFDPGDREIVLARRTKRGLFFKAGQNSGTYRWIGDLKPEHAQRIANDYAYKLSRVGLTESEWLRRGN